MPKFHNYHIYSQLASVPDGNGMLFAIDYINKENTAVKRFFRTEYIDLFLKLKSIPEQDRIFYEIIPEGHQKPKFDLEVEFNETNKEQITSLFNSLVSQVLAGIDCEMKSKNVDYSFDNNCLVFNSHGLNKLSVHIIVDKLYHKDNIKAKAFFDAVASHIDDKLKKINEGESLDSSVYSKNRQFRLLGSTKIGQNRFKQLDSITTYVPMDWDDQKSGNLEEILS